MVPDIVALLDDVFPETVQTQLSNLAGPSNGLAVVISLLEALLSRGQSKKRVTEATVLLDELRLAPSADARVFDGVAFTQEHIAASLVLSNLGRLLQDALLLPSAREAYAIALAYDKAVAGSGHWTVARDLNRLATVLHDLGELGDAYTAYQRALMIDQTQFGDRHPTVARDRNNLALLLRDSGDLEQAYWNLQMAVSIANDSLGTKHSYTQILNVNLAQLEQEIYGTS